MKVLKEMKEEMKYNKMIKTIKWGGAVLLIFVLALGLLGCGGGQVDYPPATGYGYIEIEGTVTDKETQGPLDGATVIIEGTGRSATTKDDGSYSISDVEAGTYNVTTSKSGYINQTETVTIEDATTVDFELIALVQYDLTIGSTAGVSVTMPGEGIFNYDAGKVVDLVATPADGYRFVDWTGDVDTIADVGAAATNITMSGDYSITARTVAVYDLTISSTAGGSVTTPGEGTFNYDAGTVVDLVAEADDGYRFVEWTGDVGTIGDVTAAATNITMNGDYSITASSVAVYDLAISSMEGGLVTTPGEGTFNYDAGKVVDLVAEADDGYRFVEWTGDVGTIGDVTAAATNITMSGDYSIYATFEEATVANMVRVESITYTTKGGPDHDKHLEITVLLLDNLGNPVAGASVSATLYGDDEGLPKDYSNTTDSNGIFTFIFANHDPGCYYTEVTAVAAEGLEWDGVTPENGYCKE